MSVMHVCVTNSYCDNIIIIAYNVSVPIRHSLPDARTESEFGSSENGNCSSVIHNSTDHRIYRGSICNGASVLNNGVIPALSNISNDSSSLWAAQLLTMKQVAHNIPIVLSFEVENQSYNCIQLAVFNCPDENMNASRVNVYNDTLFRPERPPIRGESTVSLGEIIKANHSLKNTSCDYLLKFYVSFMSEVTSTFFNIEFPAISSKVNHVFVGEVSFLSGAGDCEEWPIELIQTTNYLQSPKCMLDV